MSRAIALAPCPPPRADEIERFLSGETDGRALLEALYGTLGDEPVPERFLALVRGRLPPSP
jgi:hypothetical protein